MARNSDRVDGTFHLSAVLLRVAAAGRKEINNSEETSAAVLARPQAAPASRAEMEQETQLAKAEPEFSGGRSGWPTTMQSFLHGTTANDSAQCSTRLPLSTVDTQTSESMANAALQKFPVGAPIRMLFSCVESDAKVDKWFSGTICRNSLSSMHSHAGATDNCQLQQPYVDVCFPGGWVEAAVPLVVDGQLNEELRVETDMDLICDIIEAMIKTVSRYSRRDDAKRDTWRSCLRMRNSIWPLLAAEGWTHKLRNWYYTPGATDNNSSRVSYRHTDQQAFIDGQLYRILGFTRVIQYLQQTNWHGCESYGLDVKDTQRHEKREQRKTEAAGSPSCSETTRKDPSGGKMPPKSQQGGGALVVPTNQQLFAHPVPDQVNCAGTSSSAAKSRSSMPARQLANKPAASMVAACVSKGQRLEYKLESNGGDATWCRGVVQRTVAKVYCANQLAVWVEMEFDEGHRLRVLLSTRNEGVVWRCAHGPDLDSGATRSASSDGNLQEQQHQLPNTPVQPTAAAPPMSTKCTDDSVAPRKAVGDARQSSTRQALREHDACLRPNPKGDSISYAAMLQKMPAVPDEKKLLSVYLRNELRSLLKRNGISYHKPGRANLVKTKIEMVADLIELLAKGMKTPDEMKQEEENGTSDQPTPRGRKLDDADGSLSDSDSSTPVQPTAAARRKPTKRIDVSLAAARSVGERISGSERTQNARQAPEIVGDATHIRVGRFKLMIGLLNSPRVGIRNTVSMVCGLSNEESSCLNIKSMVRSLRCVAHCSTAQGKL